MLSLARTGAWAPCLPTAVLGNLLTLSPALLRTLSTFDGPPEPDAQQHDKSYIDRLKVTARAGQGGNGCASFYQGASRGECRGAQMRAVGSQGWHCADGGMCACYRRRHRPHTRHPCLLVYLQGSTPPPTVAMEGMEAMWWSVRLPSEEVACLPAWLSSHRKPTLLPLPALLPFWSALLPSADQHPHHCLSINAIECSCCSMRSLAGVQQLYKAEHGLHGTKQRQHGRAGRPTVVLVPVGTVVQRAVQPGSAAAAGAATPGGGAQPQQQMGGQGQGQAGGEQQEGEEEELPEWIRRWQRPFTGQDYSSDSDGEAGESHAAAGGGGRPSGAAAAAAAAGGAPGGAAAGSQGRAHQQQQQQEEEAQQYEVLADLVEDGQEVVVAQGGAAGRGNAAIKARAHRPAPGESEVSSCRLWAVTGWPYSHTCL